MIDLHMHTTASDGKLTPEELVDLYVEHGFTTIAITDHDTCEGVAPARSHAQDRIEVITGIEIGSSINELNKTQVDVIGLFVDENNAKLLEFVKETHQNRIDQKQEMVKKLQKLGFDVSYDNIFKGITGSVGRPHLARYLHEHFPEKFESVEDVFTQLLREGKPAFVKRKDRISMQEAVDLIHHAGGVAILAHPGVYTRNESLKIIEHFYNCGGDGIESYYAYNAPRRKGTITQEESDDMNRFYHTINTELEFPLTSGGSDFHGGDRHTISLITVPEEVLAALKKKVGA